MRRLYTLLLIGATAAAIQAAAPAKLSRPAPRRVAAVETPKVLPATDITETGFTANWEAVPGADGYAVFVSSRQEVTTPGEYLVLYEDFNLVWQGSVIEPEYLTDMITNLSNEGLTNTPDWIISQCILAGGKVSGVIWTPYFDVRADDGKFHVAMTIQGYAGQEIVVSSCGSTEVQKTHILADNGANLVEMDFDNGIQDTFLRIVDNGFPDDTEGIYLDKIAYLDDIAVSQNYKVGEDIWRLVAVGESESTSLSFANMPFRHDQKRLYYDLYATSFYYPDPSDPYEYEVDYSDFSEKQEVLLVGYNSVDDISIDSNDGTQEIYDLSGRRVYNPQPGIYIIRKNSGIEKVIIK